MEEASKKKLKFRKSESFEVEFTENPVSGKLSSYSKYMTGSAPEDKQLPSEWRWIVFDGPIDPVSISVDLNGCFYVNILCRNGLTI